MLSIPHRLAAYIGIWALQRVYGMYCLMHDQNKPENLCLSCDSVKLVRGLKNIVSARQHE
jgi:hypothetical protein